MSSLRLLTARIQNITEIMQPHNGVLADMIPPTKHSLRHQPANAHIGLMDGNTFCTTLNPRLFTINLERALTRAEDASQRKLSTVLQIGFKFDSCKEVGLRALGACHYVVSRR